MIEHKELEKLVKESFNKTLVKSGRKSNETPEATVPETRKWKKTPSTAPTKRLRALESLTEALVALPKAFLLKTERLSARTKEAHEKLYKALAETFTKASSEYDAVSRDEANSRHSALRSVNRDMINNLNGMKFHELYFGNISDLGSEITMDSIPYMKLARDFGSFEKWQFDFIACCMAAREGYAITVYDTYHKSYINVVVDGNDSGIPLGGIPIICMDMWEHAYFRDYADDKKSYVIAMMREMNWNVVEARMVVAERSQLHDLWKIVPLVNSQPEAMLSAAEAAEPTPVEAVPGPEQEKQHLDQTISN